MARRPDIRIPQIDLFSERELQQQLAANIRTLIPSGVFRHRDWLPAEVELAEQQGVSRGTVRAAYRLMEDGGLVVALPKRGRFVR